MRQEGDMDPVRQRYVSVIGQSVCDAEMAALGDDRRGHPPTAPRAAAWLSAAAWAASWPP
jgi:hypothetical protein